MPARRRHRHRHEHRSASHRRARRERRAGAGRRARRDHAARAGCRPHARALARSSRAHARVSARLRGRDRSERRRRASTSSAPARCATRRSASSIHRSRASRFLGVAPRVISGDEEASLTFSGGLLGLGLAGPVTAFDIGGGSTEVISRHRGARRQRASASDARASTWAAFVSSSATFEAIRRAPPRCRP